MTDEPYSESVSMQIIRTLTTLICSFRYSWIDTIYPSTVVHAALRMGKIYTAYSLGITPRRSPTPRKTPTLGTSSWHNLLVEVAAR